MNRWARAKAKLGRALVRHGQLGLGFEVERAPVPARPTFLVSGLPPAPHLGLEVDPSTGTSSARVGSLVEASRLLLRAGVKMVDEVVYLDGRRVFAGEVMARAAEEHGEPGVARWYRRELEQSRFARAPVLPQLRGIGEARCG